MATRSVIVRLEAQVAGYVAGLGRAATATDDLGKKAAQARKSVADNHQAMQTAGTAYLAFGAAVVGGLAMAAKAAISWESAWAGVQKTTNGTPEEMDKLETSLRGLAKTLPATHEEIAGVAEAAGQLGIQRENVAAFTKTMIDLGESTNLSADEAATGLARFSNIMGTSQDDVSNLGSTLVGLGNNFATTESEILAMSMRLAGTGAQIGLSEGEVMGLATAMSSVGIEAEAGGTAMSMGMKKIDSAVRDGGGSLAMFAETAGMSADQFAQKWQDEPAAAMESFVSGLARVGEEGGSVSGILDELGVKGIREQDAFLRLAGASDILGDALARGNEEFTKNTALIEEASKRYETTESRIRIAWNNIKDAGIDAGAAVLPVIAGLADGAIGLANAFGAIPAPVQGGLTMLGGIVGVSALAAGGFLTLVPRIVDTQKAFRDLNASGSKIPGVMGKIGKAAGIAAGGLVAFEVIKGIHNSVQPGTASLEEFTQALIKLNDEQDALDSMFSGIDFGGSSRWAGEITSAGDALNELINQDIAGGVESFGATVLGIDNGMSKMADAVAKADQSIATAANSGNMELAADGFKSIAKSAEDQGVALSDVLDRFPEYKAALLDQASAAGVALSDQELLNWAMGETPAAMEAAAGGAEEAAAAIEQEAAAAEEAARVSEEMAEALAEIGLSADGSIADLAKFSEVLLNSGLVQLSANDAARGFEAAIDDVGTKIEGIVTDFGSLNGILNETGDGFNRDSEAGRAAEEAFDAVASSGSRLTQALAENQGTQEELQGSLQTTYDSLIVAAGQMGIFGDDADTAARKVMGIPKEANIDTWMSDYARQKAEETTGAAIAVPDMVAIDSWMSEAAKLTADATKKSADDVPEQETIDSWMSDAAFIEAIRTRAAALNIPESEAIDSFMSSAARNEADATTAEVLGIPEGASVSSFMANYARIEAQNLKGALDAVDGRVVNTYANHYSTTINEIIQKRGRAIDTSTSDRGYSQGGPGLATGGAIVGFGGTPGKDSVPIMAMPDEHMLTVADVKAMGGHEGVYRFRQALHGGAARFDVGGGIGQTRVSREYTGGHSTAMASTVTASVDSSGIEAAIDRAMSSWQPLTKIAGHEFEGVMEKVTRDRERR